MVGNGELQDLIAKLFPFLCYRVKDNIFILKDSIGNNMGVMEIEDISVLYFRSVKQDFLAVLRLFALAEIGGFFSPAGEGSKAARQISLTISAVLCHKNYVAIAYNAEFEGRQAKSCRQSG